MRATTVVVVLVVLSAALSTIALMSVVATRNRLGSHINERQGVESELNERTEQLAFAVEGLEVRIDEIKQSLLDFHGEAELRAGAFEVELAILRGRLESLQVRLSDAGL